MLGLGFSQLCVAGAALVGALVIFSTWPGGGGLVGACCCLAAGVALGRSYGGRTPWQWAALGLAFTTRPKVAAQAPEPYRQTGAGAVLASRPARPQSAYFNGLYLTELPQTYDDAALGVLWDDTSGCASAVLQARGGAFCLTTPQDQDRDLAAWAAVLGSVAGAAEGATSVARLQWCQRAVPFETGPLLAHLDQMAAPSAPGAAGHRQLIEAMAARAWRHDVFLVLSVRCRGRRGSLSSEGAAMLRREARALRSRVNGAGLVCEAALDSAGLERAITSYLGAPEARRAGVTWPLATQEQWSQVRVDGLWHRCYWVAELPRSGVGPEFLSPLLSSRGRRSISVVMAPVPAEKARRDAESARTAQLADAHLRAQGGFIETARQRHQARAVEGREELVAQGNSAFTFSCFVSVAAPSEAELKDDCAQLERVAAGAQLVLRPIYGQQRDALAWALPTGRGL